jgi:hypothetical protein
MEGMLDVVTRNGRSTSSFILDGRIDVTEQKLVAVIDASPRFRLRERRAGRISATARVNWATWGERIAIELSPKGTERTTVTIRVEPIVPTTRWDWGQGRRDIEAIYGALQ